MSSLHRSPSQKKSSTEKPGLQGEKPTQYARQLQQATSAFGKKFGSQPSQQFDYAAAINEDRKHSINERLSILKASAGKENDRNVENRVKNNSVLEHSDPRQIGKGVAGSNNSKDKLAAGRSIVSMTRSQVSKAWNAQPQFNAETGSAAFHKMGQQPPLRTFLGQNLDSKLSDFKIGDTNEPLSSDRTKKSIIQNKSYVNTQKPKKSDSSNSKSHHESFGLSNMRRPHHNFQSSKGLDQPNLKIPRGQSVDENSSDLVLTTKDQLLQPKNQLHSRGAGVISPRDQIINLYEAQHLNTKLVANNTVRSQSHRSRTEEQSQISERVLTTAAGGLKENTQGSTAHPAIDTTASQGHNPKSRPELQFADVSSFEPEVSNNTHVEARKGNGESNSKVQNSSRGYLLESLKKGTLNLDSGFKRTRSQLKMDDLKGIFEDDPKFIESTKKVLADQNEFSFSDEKKKGRRVDRSEEPHPNARKLDFNCPDLFLPTVATELATKDRSPKGLSNDAKKASSLLSFEKLKTQKRPEGSVEFTSIKNNLKMKRLMSGNQPGEPHCLKQTDESLFFGTLTLVGENPGRSSPRMTPSSHPLKRFRSNFKFMNNPGKPERTVFNKTADGKFIQQELALIEEELNPQGEFKHEDSDSRTQKFRPGSSGLIKHSWLNQNFKKLNRPVGELNQMEMESNQGIFKTFTTQAQPEPQLATLNGIQGEIWLTLEELTSCVTENKRDPNVASLMQKLMSLQSEESVAWKMVAIILM